MPKMFHIIEQICVPKWSLDSILKKSFFFSRPIPLPGDNKDQLLTTGFTLKSYDILFLVVYNNHALLSPSYSAPQSGYSRRHQREAIQDPSFQQSSRIQDSSPVSLQQGSTLSNGQSQTFLGVHSYNQPQDRVF